MAWGDWGQTWGSTPGRTWMRGTMTAAAVTLAMGLTGGTAHAAGSFKLRSTDVQEVGGGWHLFMTIELPKAPPMAHVPMKFVFTKTTAYERALVDGQKEPVLNRVVIKNPMPSYESMDVDFADGRGKIFKGTRFDFNLTRARGYEAGEYTLQIRTSDGVDVGGSTRLTLRGDNPVIDRRSISFEAKESAPKKDTAPAASADPSKTVPTNEVEPVGTGGPFIPPEAFQKQPEEEIKERPKGCGCSIPGYGSPGFPLGWVGVGGLALVLAPRLRRAGRKSSLPTRHHGP